MAIKFLNSVNADSGVLYVDAANDKVGIGTTSPTVPLEVSSDSTVLLKLNNSSNSSAKISTNNNYLHLDSAGYLVADKPLLAYNGLWFLNNKFIRTTEADGTWTDMLGLDSNNILKIGTMSTVSTAGHIALYTNGSEKMRIVRDGNVGIGVTNPGAKLHVGGLSANTAGLLLESPISEVNVNFSFIVGDTSLGLHSKNLVIKGSSGSSDIAFSPSSSHPGLMILDGSTGKVGIGTAGPTHKLHVAGSVNIEDDLTFGIGGFLGTSSSVFEMFSLGDIIYNADSNNNGTSNHIFRESGNELMRITTSGNVGIGTDAPSQTLDVNGTAYFRASVGVNGEGNGITVDSGYGVNGRVGLMKYPGLEGMLVSGSGTKLRLGRRTDSTSVATAGTPTIAIDIQVNTDGTIIFPQYGAGILKTNAFGAISLDTSTYLTSYTETDTLDSVTDRGATTTNAITVGGITVGDSHFIGNETFYDNLVIISSSGENINLAAANGIYFNTNAVSASNVGSNRMYLSNAGNLGIGTTSPSEKLDVVGNAEINGVLYVNKSGENTRFNSSDANGPYVSFRNNGTAKGYIGSGYHLWANPNAIADNLGIRAENQLDFGIVSGVKMTIKSSGNVGIGTTSPGAKLDIAATNSTLAISYGNTVPNNPLHTNYYGGYTGIGMDSSTAGVRIVGDTNTLVMDAGYYTSGTPQHANWNSLLRVLTNGNVGIGTTSPSGKFHSYISANRQIGHNAVGGDLGVISDNNSAPVLYVKGTGTADLVNVLDNTTNVFTIKDGGNVGIGTTSPSRTLTVKSSGADDGIVLLRNTTSGVIGSVIETGSGDGALLLATNAATTNVLLRGSGNNYINSGNLGIGTTSPDSIFHVHASFNAPAGSGDLITSKIFSSGNVAANGNTRTGLDVETIRGGWYNSDATAGNFKVSNANRIGNSNLIGVKSLATIDVDNVYTGVAAGGSLTALYGKVTTTFTTGSGPVSKGYGLRIDAPEIAAGSEISTYYGAYIDGGSVSGTLTNKYALVTEADAGNVGIGTTSPAYKLDVNGDARVDNYLRFSSAGTYLRNNASGALVLAANSGYIETGWGARLDVRDSSGSANIRLYGGGNSWFNGGNVGIGTTNPSYKLDVNGDGRINGVTFVASGATRRISTHSTAGLLQLNGGTNASNGAFINIAGDSYASGDYIDYYASKHYFTGNVGIGTTSPGYKLSVNGDIHIPQNEYIYFDNTAHYIRRGSSSVELQGYNGLDLRTAGSSRVFITQAGNVGIGTTSPVGKIDIRGNYGRWRINGYGGMYFGNDTDTGYTRYIHPRSDGSLSFGRIADTNLSGTAPDNYAASSYDQFYLDSSGTAYFNGGINFAGVNGANFVVNTDGQRVVWEHQRNGTRKMTFYHEADADTFNFNFESGNKLQINGNRIVTVNELGTASASAATDFVAVTGDTMTGRLTLNQNVTIGGTTPSNGNLVITDGAYTLGIDSNEIHSTNAMYIGTNSGDLILRPDGNTTFTSGNVGIGTTSPQRKLDVRGGYFITTDGGTSELAFVQGGSGYAYFGNLNAGKAAFGNSEDWTTLVADGGKVGIGTASPSEKLHVVGTIKTSQTSGASENTLIYNQAGAKWGSSTHPGIIESSGNNSFLIGSSQNIPLHLVRSGAIALTIGTSGNVGIGTSSPSEKLHVSGNVRIEGDLTVNGSYTQIDTDVNTTEQWNVTNDGTGPAVTINQTGAQDIMDVQDDGTSVFYIEDGGNVGIGTTSPVSPLTVKSNSISSGESGIVIQAKDNTNSIIKLGERGTDGGRLEMLDANVAKIALYTDGTDNYINAGKVGIGTTSPAHKLDIYSNENVPLRVHRPSNANLDSSGAWGIGFSTRGDANTSTTDTRAGVFSYYNGNLFLAAANTSIVSDPDAYARLTITNNGNVGIGTSSPGSRLEIDMDDTAGNRLGFTGDGTTTGSALWTNWTTGASYLDFRLGGNSNTYTKMRITNAGNVGIGTTSPLYKLDVASGNSSNAFGLSLSGTARLKMYADGTYNYYAAQSGQSHRFTTTGGAEFLITNGGNVGIGTTSPSTRLHVTAASSNSQLTLERTGSATGKYSIYTNTNNLVINNVAANTYPLTILNNGNVGIGTTAPSEKLSVVGNLSITSGGYRIYNNSTVLSATSTSLLTINAGGFSNVSIANGNVGIGYTSPIAKLDVNGSARIGGKTIYSKGAGSVDTTGYAVAGLLSAYNGNSAKFKFDMHGGAGNYQRVVYSCYNASGTWYAKKVVDEGTNQLDVEASANGATITFTFKAVTTTQLYTPIVEIEHLGGAIDTQYL